MNEQMDDSHKTVSIKGIDIDEGLVPLIKELWAHWVRTYECCQGDVDDGFVIVHKDDEGLAVAVARKYFDLSVEAGTGGYDPRDYNPKASPHTRDYTFIRLYPKT